MSGKTETIKRFGRRTNLATAVLSIIALLTAIGLPLKAQLLLASIGVCIILTNIVTGIRVTGADDLRICGKAIIQGAWFYMSFSLSYLIMTPAPYFEMPPLNMAVTSLIGIIILIVGAYSLLKTRKETGVMLSI